MKRYFQAAALLAVLILIGCEDPFIDPFATGKHFTVYGYLSPFESEHVVRVVPVRRFPEDIEGPGEPQSEIDAVVETTNLATGQTVRWVHSLRRLDDGSFGHVFSAQFVVSRGTTYRLTVRRSDGAESVAETTVPHFTEAEALPATVSGDTVQQIIRWKGIPGVDDVNIIYCAAPVGVGACFDGADGGGLLIPYGPVGRRVGNDWEVPVELSRDFAFLRDIAGLSPELPLQLNSLQIRVLGLDEKWTVYDDPDVFAQPTSLNNVENGFGYWGSVGNGLFEWTPDESALAEMGIQLPN